MTGKVLGLRDHMQVTQARNVLNKHSIRLRKLSHGTILTAPDSSTAFLALLELAKIFLPEPEEEKHGPHTDLD